MNIKNLLNGNGKTKKTGATKQVKAQRKLEDWAKEHAEMDAATEALRMKLANLQAEIDAVAYPYLMRIATLEIQIKGRVSNLGTSVTGEGAKAQYRKAYDRTSWNTGKLEVLAVKTPEIKLCISKVSHIKANVSIRLA